MLLSRTYQAPLLAALLVVLAGCTGLFGGDDEPKSYEELGFDGESWPSLENHTVVVLHGGGFGAYDDAAERFNNLTNATVQVIAANGPGGVLKTALAQRADPSFDVIMGLDNAYFHQARAQGLFAPFKPQLSSRIDPQYVFFTEENWRATPVQHGYTALVVDHRHELLNNTVIEDLFDVRTHADKVVVPDPTKSAEGLGFLLATIATFGEDAVKYDWEDYWEELFRDGLLVTRDWLTAYEDHFSGGYGVEYGGQGDYPVVAAYTSTPAYEWYYDAIIPLEDEDLEAGILYGNDTKNLSKPLLKSDATFHRIEIAGVAANATDPIAAQAWIEFLLTEEFQELIPPKNGLYPVTRGIDIRATYQGLDPTPGTFDDADLRFNVLGFNVDRWLDRWLELCEDYACI